LAGSGKEQRKGKVAGRDGIRGGAGPGEAEGEEERKGTGERLTGGAGSSAKQKKRKQGAGGVGCSGEEAGGPLGRRAGRGRKVSFFQTLFKTTFKLKFESNFF
jgi:hypothetical protein